MIKHLSIIVCLAWLSVVMGQLQKSKNKKQTIYMFDIKGSSLKYRIIQYKEPLNYGKEHKECTR